MSAISARVVLSLSTNCIRLPVTSAEPTWPFRSSDWKRSESSPESSNVYVGFARIGLSATAAPVDVLAKFLVGVDRPCVIAQARAERQSIVEVFSPIRRNPYPPAGFTGARLYAELADLIRRRQSVLVFTNVRSAAEQIGLRLRELMPDLSDQIETHHASLDRSVRLEVEDRLKMANCARSFARPASNWESTLAQSTWW